MNSPKRKAELFDQGVRLAVAMDWDIIGLLEVCAAALEDSNAHRAAGLLYEELKREEKAVELSEAEAAQNFKLSA